MCDTCAPTNRWHTNMISWNAPSKTPNQKKLRQYGKRKPEIKQGFWKWLSWLFRQYETKIFHITSLSTFQACITLPKKQTNKQNKTKKWIVRVIMMMLLKTCYKSSNQKSAKINKHWTLKNFKLIFSRYRSREILIFLLLQRRRYWNNWGFQEISVY